MPKTIVTHMSPDLDAVTAIWLVKRFMPEWEEATHAFVQAGETLEGKDPDEDPNIIHVDTGLGRFDHHQVKDRNLSATKLVFNFLQEKKYIKGEIEEALARISDFVTTIDSFGEVFFHDPASDIYDFSLYQLIEGLKTTKKKDIEIYELASPLLDGVLQLLRNKVKAEEEIKKGFVFESKWGRTLAVESKNDQVLKLALKMGFNAAIRKNPDEGFLRINTIPSDKNDLTPLYEKVRELDPEATWYLH